MFLSLQAASAHYSPEPIGTYGHNITGVDVSSLPFLLPAQNPSAAVIQVFGLYQTRFCILISSDNCNKKGLPPVTGPCLRWSCSHISLTAATCSSCCAKYATPYYGWRYAEQHSSGPDTLCKAFVSRRTASSLPNGSSSQAKHNWRWELEAKT